MRQAQGTSLSCRVALSLWSSWRCLLGQTTQKLPLSWGDALSCPRGSLPACPACVGCFVVGLGSHRAFAIQVTSTGPAILEGATSTGMWEAGAGRAQGHGGVRAWRCLEQQKPLIAAFLGAFPQGMCERAPLPVPLGLAICSQCLCQHQPLAPEPRKH